MALNVSGILYNLSEEKLEIEKLLERRSLPPSTDFDSLFDKAYEIGKTKQLKNELGGSSDEYQSTPEEPENTDEETADEETTDVDSGEEKTTTDEEDGEDSKDEKDIPDKEKTEDSKNEDTDVESDKTATESYQELHELSLEQYLLTEAVYYEDLKTKYALSQEGEYMNFIGSKLAEGGSLLGTVAYRTLIKNSYGEDGLLTKLAKLGFEYGKVGILKISKGIFYALSATATALFKGSKLLVRIIKNREKSYTALLNKISKARKVLEVIKNTPVSDEVKVNIYADQVTISLLKVGSSLEFYKHINGMYVFTQKYDNIIVSYTASLVGRTKALIDQVMSGKISINPSKYIDDLPPLDLKKVSNSELINTMRSSVAFPGDKFLLLDVPRNDLKDYDDIRYAYHQSDAYITIDNKLQNASVKECRYLTVEEMEKYLDLLEDICRSGLNTRESYKKINKLRGNLKVSLSSYIDYLVSKERDITLKESMAEYISLRTAYIDQVLIAGHMKLHDQLIATISSCLSYIKASMDELID